MTEGASYIFKNYLAVSQKIKILMAKKKVQVQGAQIPRNEV